MALAGLIARTSTSLPLRARLARQSYVAVLQHHHFDASLRHQLLANASAGRRWASQNAKVDFEAAVGEQERPHLPEHLQLIVDDYNAQRAKEEQQRFWLWKMLMDTRYAPLLGMAVAGSIALGISAFDDVSSGVHEVSAWLLRRMEPERARQVFIGAAAWGLMPRDYEKDDPYLVSEPLEAMKFSTPVGLASGFDREARAPNAFFDLGFGFVEVGPIVAANGEADADVVRFRDRLAARNRNAQVSSLGLLGVAIGGGRAALPELVEEFGHHADYFVVDLGLVPAAEREEEGLRKLLAATVQAASDFSGLAAGGKDTSPPVFLRVPAGWPQADSVALANTAIAGGAKGLILTRGESKHKHFLEVLRAVYGATGVQLVLVADGVTSGIEALECHEAGATLVQISSLLVTEGPAACRRIKSELATVLWKEHYTCIQEAIGSAHRKKTAQRGGRKKNPWRKRE